MVYREYETHDIEEITKTSDNAHGQRSNLNLKLVNEQIATLDPSVNIKVMGIPDLAIDVSDRYNQDDGVKDKKTKNCPHCGKSIDKVNGEKS